MGHALHQASRNSCSAAIHGARAPVAGPPASEPARVQPDRHPARDHRHRRSGTSGAGRGLPIARMLGLARKSIPTYATAITVRPTPERPMTRPGCGCGRAIAGSRSSSGKVPYWTSRGSGRSVSRRPDFTLFQDAGGFYAWTEAQRVGYVLDELGMPLRSGAVRAGHRVRRRSAIEPIEVGTPSWPTGPDHRLARPTPPVVHGMRVATNER